MKRTERHHLKENELARRLSAARDFVETQQRLITTLVIVAAVVGLAFVAFTIYRGQVAARGDELLADAMVALNAPVVPAGAQGAEGLPAAAQIGAANTFSTEAAKLNVAVPKLKATADAYPDTPAGITARYHLGAALASLGRHDEALQVFDEVVKRAGADTLYGRMATMGKADTQASSGQLDSAIATWKDLTTRAAEDLPVDAILMELARAYLQKGDTEEARKTFSQIVDQHADSPYSAEARRELESLKG